MQLLTTIYKARHMLWTLGRGRNMAWFLPLPAGRPSTGPGVGAPVSGEKQAMPWEGDQQDGEGHPTQ